MRKHLVTFYSPGTLFPETTTKDIPSWDPRVAAQWAKDIVERHGARPFAFRFSTILMAEPIDDGEGGKLEVTPREVAKSGTHFLGGRLNTLDEVELRGDPNEEILLWNMNANRWPIVCILNESGRYRSSQPFEVEDVLCHVDGTVLERGNDPVHVGYRLAKIRQIEAKSRSQSVSAPS